MIFRHKLNNMRIRITAMLKWLLIGIIIGILCGITGGLFSKGIAFVTGFRHTNGWIILLLPLGGLLSVLIYKLMRVTNVGTDDAVRSAHTNEKVSFLLAPATFICSVITHLFGGSAGREGAALKMGAGVSALVSETLSFNERDRRTLALAGMSGVFAAVFGAPVGAAVFTLEVARSKSIRRWGIIVSLISSFSAFVTARLMNVSFEKFSVSDIPSFSADAMWRIALLAMLGGVVSFVFCSSMTQAAKTAKRLLKNEYLRIFVCALLIVALTFVVGTQDYNGGGMEIVSGIFEGDAVRLEAFIFKIVFTALTVAAGYKGGEIVPAFFVGATFGGAAAPFLGLSSPFGAAIGMTALFCGVTNCPIATVFIAVEMFGFTGLPVFIIASAVSFLFSGEPSLYDGKKYPFKALCEETIE